MTQPLSLMQRLRRDTEPQHRALEALPFFTALEAGELPLSAYAGFLRALHTVHAALETEAGTTREPAVAAVWRDTLRRLPLLERDLAALAPRSLPPTPMAEISAHLVAQRIRRRAGEEPCSLLGYLYVLEGSTLGGGVVRTHAARAYGLTDDTGTAYLRGHGRETKAYWTGFSRRMDDALGDSAVVASVVDAAREAFAGVGSVVAALHPAASASPRDLAWVLNPEAGHHEIPEDPRELEAALRAGERSWREFPYYAWRYAERGERFTRSDSAWLVSLVSHGPEMVEAQTRWLGTVLASRGMPRWLLERHLAVLHAELSAAVPGRRAAYESLLHAAHALGSARHRYLDDAAMERHRAAFDERVGPDWAARLPRTGGLLAAAVADESAGIAQAVTSLEGWLTDPARFPAHWIEAVRSTLGEARAASRPAG
jgi:heme oxygenase